MRAYSILGNRSMKGLADAVQERCQDGWEPIGAPFIDELPEFLPWWMWWRGRTRLRRYWFQAMGIPGKPVKPKPATPSKKAKRKKR